VQIILGVVAPPEIPTWATRALHFDPAYLAESLAAQRAALAVCQGTHPALNIRSRSCWPIEFREWLALRGMRYPVPAEEFYGLLSSFFEQRGQGTKVAVDGDRFWLDQSGKLRGFSSTFKAVVPEDPGEREAFFKAWSDYIAMRNSMVPPKAGQVWAVLPAAVLAEEVSAIRSNAVWSMCVFVGIVAFFALVCTCSKGIAAAVVLALSFALLFFGVLLTGLAGQGAGTLEVLMVVAYLACLAVPVLRMAMQYARTREGPGPEPFQGGDAAASPKWRLSPELDWQLMSVTYDASANRNGQGKKVAQPMSAYETLLWPGAIAAERKARSTAAVTRSADCFVAGAIGAALAGPSLLTTSMAGLGHVALIVFCGYVAALPMALGLLPMLLELGFGPSRVRRKARRIFRAWYRNGAPDSRELDVLMEQGVDVALMDGGLASEVLGWPYTLLARQARFDADDPEMQASFCSRLWRCFGAIALASAGEEQESVYAEVGGADTLMMEEVPDESEAHILALDVHGATAMPPYHVVMEVRDKFEVAG